MSAVATTPSISQRSQGRAYFWAGLGACLLGVALVIAQFTLLKYLDMPWYSPALASLGALLLLVAVASRPTILRVIVLLLVAAFAGMQWYLMVWKMKLPAYEGPRAGQQMPSFTAALADGTPITDADFRDGSRHVMTFFRGRW